MNIFLEKEENLFSEKSRCLIIIEEGNNKNTEAFEENMINAVSKAHDCAKQVRFRERKRSYPFTSIPYIVYVPVIQSRIPYAAYRVFK